MTSVRRPEIADRGLTLVELIVVVTLLGLITTVIAAAFVTIARTAPSAQFRIDDARSTRAMQTWLARDIASTPPNDPIVLGQGGYIFSPTEPASPKNCGVTTGVNILHMTWVENGGSGVSYYANYRLVPDGSRHKVVRYICSSSSPSPTSVSLTSGVSSAECSSRPFSEPNGTGTVESVDICVVSLESDTGLNAGGGDSQEVTLTVSSRNYVDTL